MSSIYDMDEPLPSQEERNAAMEAATQQAQIIFRARKKWALHLTAAVVLILAASIFVSKGFPLENLKLFHILIVVYLILIMPCLVCLGMWFNAWQLVRNVKKTAREVKEEGY